MKKFIFWASTVTIYLAGTFGLGYWLGNKIGKSLIEK